MLNKPFTDRLIVWSAVATVLAGVIHLVIVPEHWNHAPAHGLFFLITGILQIVWGLAIWRKPSPRVFSIGAVLAGWLIVLYVMTRLLPAPFGHGPEAVSTIDIACKLCEGVGMVTLAILIFQGTWIDSGRSQARRTLTAVVALSFIIAFVTYGTARAAEPLFPSLAAEEHTEHNEQEMHDEATDAGHDEDIP